MLAFRLELASWINFSLIIFVWTSTSVPIQLLANLGWPPHAHKSTPRFFSLHLKAPPCTECSFIKWRTLPLMTLKCFAIWMKNPLLWGRFAPMGPPLIFRRIYPWALLPQIRGPLGACISLCKTHPSCYLFNVGGKNLTSMNNALMPWGMVVTSWSKQPSSPHNQRFASYFMLG